MVNGGQHPEASPAKHREAPQCCLTPPLSPCFIFCIFLYFLLLISLLPQHRHFPPASCLKHGTVLLRKKKTKNSSRTLLISSFLCQQGKYFCSCWRQLPKPGPSAPGRQQEGLWAASPRGQRGRGSLGVQPHRASAHRVEVCCCLSVHLPLPVPPRTFLFPLTQSC